MSSLREFYKSSYALEIARKAELTAALSFPVGVIALVVGALAVMAKDLHYPLKIGEQILLAGIGLCALACAVSVYFLIRSLYNYTYAYAPTSLQLKEFKEKLLMFHKAGGISETEANAWAESETLDHIDSEYAADTDRNSANNDIKSSFLHRANGAIIAAVILGAVTSVAYVTNSILSPHTVQKIELINLREVPTMSGNEPFQAATTPSPSVPQQPARPTAPPSKLVKEDKSPPKPPPLKK